MRTSTAVREPLAPELPPAPRRRFASSRDSSRDSCRMARLHSGGSWCTPALCPDASRGAEPLGRVHEGHEVRSPGTCRRGRFGCLCWKLRGCAGAAGVGAAPQGPAHPGNPHHTLHRKATAAAQALVSGSYCLVVDEAFLEKIKPLQGADNPRCRQSKVQTANNRLQIMRTPSSVALLLCWLELQTTKFFRPPRRVRPEQDAARRRLPAPGPGSCPGCRQWPLPAAGSA